MKTYLVVTAQGGGKTEWIVEKLKQFSHMPVYIYDPRGGYDKYSSIVNKAKNAITMKDFLKLVPLKYPSRVNVVYEDASGLIPSTGDLPKDVTDHLCTVRHTKNQNFWVYHDPTLFNKKFLSFVDFIVLGRTTGDPGEVRRKFKNFPKILAAYEYIQRVTRGTRFDFDKKKFLPGSYIDELTGKVVIRSAAYSKKWYHKKVIISISQ